ncbi:DUF1707 domain-containing protein [Streptomyces eurythermus]|uniref:DUF1707 SHOCT-like domain-containing protein n=1 Tax=Streptomyces eurythermus TaxID=42237 RepID=UPI003702CDFD
MGERTYDTDRGRQAEPGHDVLVSEEERERVVERVRDAVADGRLPLDELDGRLDRIHAARTRGELRAAGSGLPAPGPRGARVVAGAPTSRFALGVFGAPRVVVKGLALFGAVVTKSPRK